MARKRKAKQIVLEPMGEDKVKEIVKDWFDARAAWSFAPVSRGMGKHGVHDRLGCVPVVITPEMVGWRIGVFVSVEAKSTGRREERLRGMTDLQYDNMKEILEAGGATTVCDGEEDLQNLERWFPWLTKPISPKS